MAEPSAHQRTSGCLTLAAAIAWLRRAACWAGRYRVLLYLLAGLVAVDGLIAAKRRTEAEVLLPAGEGMDVKVKIGDKVRGGETVLLRFP